MWCQDEAFLRANRLEWTVAVDLADLHLQLEPLLLVSLHRSLAFAELMRRLVLVHHVDRPVSSPQLHGYRFDFAFFFLLADHLVRRLAEVLPAALT